jgi:hypothetical protein
LKKIEVENLVALSLYVLDPLFLQTLKILFPSCRSLYTGTEERRQSFRGLTTAPSHISYWLIYVCFPAANEKPDLAANKYRSYSLYVDDVG